MQEKSLYNDGDIFFRAKDYVTYLISLTLKTETNIY